MHMLFKLVQPNQSYVEFSFAKSKGFHYS